MLREVYALGELFTLLKATVDFWGRCKVHTLTNAN